MVIGLKQDNDTWIYSLEIGLGQCIFSTKSYNRMVGYLNSVGVCTSLIEETDTRVTYSLNTPILDDGKCRHDLWKQLSEEGTCPYKFTQNFGQENLVYFYSQERNGQKEIVLIRPNPEELRKSITANIDKVSGSEMNMFSQEQTKEPVDLWDKMSEFILPHEIAMLDGIKGDFISGTCPIKANIFEDIDNRPAFDEFIGDYITVYSSKDEYVRQLTSAYDEYTDDDISVIVERDVAEGIIKQLSDGTWLYYNI